MIILQANAEASLSAIAMALAKEKVSVSWCFTIILFHDVYVWIQINDYFIFVLQAKAEASLKAIAKALAKEKVGVSWCCRIVLFHDCISGSNNWRLFYFRFTGAGRVDNFQRFGQIKCEGQVQG